MYFLFILIWQRDTPYYDEPYDNSLPDGSWLYWRIIIAIIFIATWYYQYKLVPGKIKGRYELLGIVGALMAWPYFWHLIDWLLPVITVIGIGLFIYSVEKEMKDNLDDTTNE